MAIIYEYDVARLGGNLQTTVAYLLSLHKNEYEWNLLGIKVVGSIDALPIPDGIYEYGDAYMVGTSAPYDMWIYTRADEFHSSAYWFNIGKFPAPGPQGPKGDGFETVVNWNTGTVQSVTYDTETGVTIETTAEIQYKDSTTGQTKTQTFPCIIKLPLIPGKYIGMDANSDGDALTVKVDVTELALDYYKIDKTQTTSSIPYWSGTTAGVLKATSGIAGATVVLRDAKGSADFYNMRIGNAISNTDGGYLTDARMLAYATNKGYSEVSITKTATNEGTIYLSQLNILQNYPQLHIQYDNQIYYRMDPMDAPDGTLNYIHIDSVQDGNSGYKATGKCFSITVSTRAWQVVDVNFASPMYQHDIFMRVNGSGSDSWAIKLTVTTSNSGKINSTTLAKYIYGGENPGSILMSGTPVSVYLENISGSAGLGLGRIGYHQPDPNVSPTYLWEFTDMTHAHTLSGNSIQYTIERIVDTVTEV